MIHFSCMDPILQGNVVVHHHRASRQRQTLWATYTPVPKGTDGTSASTATFPSRCTGCCSPASTFIALPAPVASRSATCEQQYQTPCLVGICETGLLAGHLTGCARVAGRTQCPWHPAPAKTNLWHNWRAKHWSCSMLVVPHRYHHGKHGTCSVKVHAGAVPSANYGRHAGNC
jgi:hypothetical protein